uniref:Uncharacterized protein n=1 Tax=Rhodnius prolixus TaxID=13249 RepID=A0A4P6D718_RHOPR
MIASMSPVMKQRYNELMKRKTEMQQKAEQLKGEIESIEKMMPVLGDQVYVSPVKMEMFENEVKLWDLNNKKSNLLAEIRDNLEPEDEFKSLLNRIKEDKLQIGIMEKAISEISEEIRHGEAVLTQLQEKKVDESRNVAKYLELRKKELAIDDFLGSVESRRQDELNSLDALDAQILPLLKTLAARLSTIPTLADYKSMSLSQSHVVKRDLLNTVKSVSNEFINLFCYLNKIVKMGNKVEEDLNKVTKNTHTMSVEMETYTNIADLETGINKKKEELTAARQTLSGARSSTKSSVIEVTAKFNEVQRQLSESERYAQILFIEKSC